MVSARWVGAHRRYRIAIRDRYPGDAPRTFPQRRQRNHITINGIDYTLGGGFISLQFKYDNAVRLPSGFYPGSGEQNGYAVRGRMEYGTRVISLTFVARASKGSVEFNNLMSLKEGVTTITLQGGQIGTGAGYHGMNISAPRTVLASVVNGDTDGIVNVNCGVTFLKPASGDIITMSARDVRATWHSRVAIRKVQESLCSIVTTVLLVFALGAFFVGTISGTCAADGARELHRHGAGVRNVGVSIEKVEQCLTGTSEIELTIFLKSGGRSVLVRWPTDEEWAARAAKRKAIFHNLGRSASRNHAARTGRGRLGALPEDRAQRRARGDEGGSPYCIA